MSQLETSSGLVEVKLSLRYVHDRDFKFLIHVLSCHLVKEGAPLTERLESSLKSLFDLSGSKWNCLQYSLKRKRVPRDYAIATMFYGAKYATHPTPERTMSTCPVAKCEFQQTLNTFTVYIEESTGPRILFSLVFNSNIANHCE
jgi:hypothetical protein